MLAQLARVCHDLHNYSKQGMCFPFFKEGKEGRGEKMVEEKEGEQ